MSRLTYGFIVTILQIEKNLLDNLQPKWEEMRDSRIAYNLTLKTNYDDARKEYRSLTNEVAKKEQYKKIFGFFNKETKKQEGGIIHSWSKKEYTLIHERKATDEEIRAFFTKEYAKSLKSTVDSITKQIAKYNPIAIEEGCSEHDFNFVLTMEDNTKKSYTINTILASGDVQVLHYRVLKKLHKSIVN